MWGNMIMSKDEYLITDAPLKALTVFAMPMILGSFFQQIYNMADSIIVGQFVGSSALAAVGACAALTNVFICGTGSRCWCRCACEPLFRCQRVWQMKTIVSTSLISFLVLSIILGVFGFGFSHCDDECIANPWRYTGESGTVPAGLFCGLSVFVHVQYSLYHVHLHLAQSKIPLGLLIFSSILNIVMDLWMVAGLGLGVFGAALATLIAQGISAVFSLLIFLYRMRRYKSAFAWFDGRELRSMLQIAVPSVLQQSTVLIGMMIVQAVVNPFAHRLLQDMATMRVENVFS